jgi:hypothetical protein
MSWNGSYASSFEKDLLPVRAQIRQKAVQAIGDVLSNPYQGKKLQGRSNRFSVRLGDRPGAAASAANWIAPCITTASPSDTRGRLAISMAPRGPSATSQLRS